MSRFNIPGLLGATGELPTVLTRGLLGPLPVNPQMGLDPNMVKQSQDQAVSDMAFGMLAAGKNPAGLYAARQSARDNYSGRMVDLLREQEIVRMKQEREDNEKKRSAYRATLPAEIQPIADVAGLQNVAQAQIQSAFATPEAEKNPNSYEEFMLAGGGSIEDPVARAAAYRDFLFQSKSAGAVQVNVGGEKTKEVWQEKLIPEITKQIPTFQANADKAAKSVRQLDGMIIQAQKTGLTGAFAPGVVGAASFARSLGIDIAPEAVKDARTFQTSLNNSVLQWMATTGGARGYTEKETAMLMDAFTKIQDDIPSRMAILSLARQKAASDYEDSVQSLKTTRWQVKNLQEGGDGIPEMPELPAAPSAPKYYEGQTATNPDTKEKLVYRNGRWVKVGK